MGEMDNDMDDMNDAVRRMSILSYQQELDKIIDSVQNPEKYKDKEKPGEQIQV